MLKILKNKKGTTLIETAVAMIIFSLIAVSVASIMVPTINAYSMANSLAETNTLLDNVSNELLSDLANATGVDISGSTLTITTNMATITYSVSGGHVHKNGLTVLDERYYRGKTVDIEYYEDDRTTLISSGAAPRKFYVRVILYLNDGGITSIITDRFYAVNMLGVA